MKERVTQLIKRSGILLLTAVVATFNSSAQSASSYGFQAFAGTFTQLTGGTSIAVIADDIVSPAYPIGFNFEFCGTVYTQFKVCSNGFINFNTSNTNSSLTNAEANLTYVRPGLMYLWDDLNGNTGTATYHLTGTAPNRELTIQLLDWKWNWSSSPANSSFQIKLYETTNVIDFIYRQEAAAGNPSGSSGATIGICDATTYLNINDGSTNPTASSTVFTTTITQRPATGQVYRWLPPVNCSLVTFNQVANAIVGSDTVCMNSSVNLSLDYIPPPAMGITYQWQSSPSSTGPWTNVGTASTNSSGSISGLTGNTYVRCLVQCNGNTAVTSSTAFINVVHVDPPQVVSAARCGLGSLNLSATGLGLKWYDTPTGGNPLTNGSNFQTPVLTSSATYYVESSAGGGPKVTQVGNGTSFTTYTGAGGPFNNYWRVENTQYLYTAADLIAAGANPGTLVSFAFNCGETPMYPLLNYRIGYMFVPSSMTTLAWQNPASFTNVQTIASFSPAPGWHTFTLPTPVTWNGTDGIVIMTCMDQTQPTYSLSGGTHEYTTTSGRMLYYASDGVATGCTQQGTSAPTHLPNCRFEIIEGCTSARIPVTATITPAPPVTVAAHPGNLVCAGHSATLTASSATNPDYSYSWTPGNLLGNSVSVSPTVPTTYTIMAIDTNTSSPYYGCAYETTININTASGPPAEITPSSLSAVCPGIGHMLSTPTGTGYQYQWSLNGVPINGATNSNYNAIAPGSYSVKVLDNFGCDSTAPPVQKTDHFMPNVSLSYNSSLEFCEGNTVILHTPSGPGITHQWYRDNNAINGATDSVYMAMLPGTYTVEVSNPQNCTQQSNSVQVTVNGLPQPTITQNGWNLSTGVYVTYQWYRNGQAIGGATGQNYTVTQDGAYTVEVTDANGCRNQSQVVIISNTTGIDDVSGLSKAVKLYPNPTNGKIRIESPVGVKLYLQNATGQLLGSYEGVTELDLSNYANGIYVVTIQTLEGAYIRTDKVVKQ